MTDNSYYKLDRHIVDLFNLVDTFRPGKIPDLGAMIISLEELAKAAQIQCPGTFLELVLALKGYVESRTLENLSHTKPIEEGILLLKALMEDIKNRTDSNLMISGMIKCLNERPPILVTNGADEPGCHKTTKESSQGEGTESCESYPDFDILLSFMEEAQTSLAKDNSSG